MQIAAKDFCNSSPGGLFVIKTFVVGKSGGQLKEVRDSICSEPMTLDQLADHIKQHKIEIGDETNNNNHIINYVYQFHPDSYDRKQGSYTILNATSVEILKVADQYKYSLPRLVDNLAKHPKTTFGVLAVCALVSVWLLKKHSHSVDK